MSRNRGRKFRLAVIRIIISRFKKVNRWTDADTLFKEKNFTEGLDAFLNTCGGAAQNVYERNGAEGRFHLYQGSKIVRGTFNNELLKAEVMLARMPQPSVPVMRRLLEMNFNLYYSRFALDNDRLCMTSDSDIETASPSEFMYQPQRTYTKANNKMTCWFRILPFWKLLTANMYRSYRNRRNR